MQVEQLAAKVGVLFVLILLLAGCGDARPSETALAHQVAAAGDLVEFDYTDDPYREPYAGLIFTHVPNGRTVIKVPGRRMHPVHLDDRQRRLILTGLVRCGFFSLDHHYQAWLGNGGGQSCAIAVATSSGLRNHVVCFRRVPAEIEEFRRYFADLVVQEGWDHDNLTLGSYWPYTDFFQADADRDQKETLDHFGELTSLMFSESDATQPGWRIVIRPDGSGDITAPGQTAAPVIIDAATRRSMLIALDISGFFSNDPCHNYSWGSDASTWPVYHPTPPPPGYACTITATTAKGQHQQVDCQGSLTPQIQDLRDFLHALIVDKGWDLQHPKNATEASAAP